MCPLAEVSTLQSGWTAHRICDLAGQTPPDGYEHLAHFIRVPVGGMPGFNRTIEIRVALGMDSDGIGPFVESRHTVSPPFCC